MNVGGGEVKRDGVVQSTPRRPTPVRVAQALLWLKAALWATVAVVTGLRQFTGAAHALAVGWTLALLMLANAIILVWLGIGIGRQQRRAYYLVLALQVVHIAVGVMDQLGASDWAGVLLDVALLALLLVTHKYYLSTDTQVD